MGAKTDAARLVTWRPDLRADFERLNREWIERWFAVEDADREMFADPEAQIVEPGGQIFFVVDEAGVRGTCAVIRHDGETFELAKMAVAPAWRGQGIGRRMAEALIDRARRLGAARLELVSQTALPRAVPLYRNLGFREIPMGEQVYQRANIKMELRL